MCGLAIAAVMIAGIATGAVCYAESSSIAYEWQVAYGIGVHIVRINLNDKNVCVTPALTSKGSSESFKSFINRTHPAAAVTGTYFDMKSRIPVGDIAIDGKLLNRGHIGRGLCVSRDNKASFSRRNYKEPWSGSESVLCGGPRLITNGKIGISPKAEGFRDRSIFKRARRVAVGLTKENKMVFVAVNSPVYLSTLARIMQKIGCVDAINLDGGASSALQYRGKTLAKPGRRLTNLLLVYDSRSQYEQQYAQLAPTLLKEQRPQHSNMQLIAAAQ